MSPQHWQAMYLHVADQAPLEACGLVAGKNNSVETVLPVQNAARSTVRYRMDPQEQYNAFMQIEDHGLSLIGIYHSHPSGPAIPSFTDIEEAAYDVIYLIWYPTNYKWTARGFQIEKGHTNRVSIHVLDK